jgi:hypothetical protein
MKRILSAIAVLLALFGAAIAPLALAQQSGVKPLRPALWQVSDRDTTIYLFGTVHVLPAGQTWFSGKLAWAVNSSDELVTELGKVESSDLIAAVTELGFFTSGPTLRERMTAEQRGRYEAALLRVRIAPEQFDRLKPWYAANQLLLEQLKTAGISGVDGPEALLTQRFSAAGKKQIGLETVRYQLGLFDALPADLQLRYLDEVVTEGQDLVKQFDAIQASWGSGRVEQLGVVLEGTVNEPAIHEPMYVNRNRAWSQWIKTRLDQPGKVFVAIGAGHLTGPGSLQDQLRGLGIKVRRIQ